MSRKQPNHATTDLLEKFLKDQQGKPRIQIEELMNAVEGRAFGLALLILALANLAIAHVPGISTVLAVPVVLFAAQMALGRTNPWLPKSVMQHKVRHKTFARIINYGCWLLNKIEVLIEPRLPRLVGERAQRLLGVVCLFIGLLMAVPIPFNYLPPIGLVLISLGMLEKDGLFAALGLVLGGLGIVYQVAFFSGLSHLFEHMLG